MIVNVSTHVCSGCVIISNTTTSDKIATGRSDKKFCLVQQQQKCELNVIRELFFAEICRLFCIFLFRGKQNDMAENDGLIGCLTGK